MPYKTIIFLTGMPAAGKTYWARELAREYGHSLIDLDYYVVLQEQASVPALFAQYGEQGFREREQKHLKKAIAAATGTTIIATGGGTPCYGNNMQLMKEAGTVVYLQADVDTLLFNLDTSDDVRPMLNNRGDLGAYLHGLLAKRRGFYEQAHHILHTKDISLTTFEKIISVNV